MGQARRGHADHPAVITCAWSAGTDGRHSPPRLPHALAGAKQAKQAVPTAAASGFKRDIPAARASLALHPAARAGPGRAGRTVRRLRGLRHRFDRCGDELLQQALAADGRRLAAAQHRVAARRRRCAKPRPQRSASGAERHPDDCTSTKLQRGRGGLWLGAAWGLGGAWQPSRQWPPGLAGGLALPADACGCLWPACLPSRTAPRVGRREGQRQRWRIAAIDGAIRVPAEPAHTPTLPFITGRLKQPSPPWDTPSAYRLHTKHSAWHNAPRRPRQHPLSARPAPNLCPRVDAAGGTVHTVHALAWPGQAWRELRWERVAGAMKQIRPTETRPARITRPRQAGGCALRRRD